MNVSGRFACALDKLPRLLYRYRTKSARYKRRNTAMNDKVITYERRALNVGVQMGTTPIYRARAIRNQLKEKSPSKRALQW